MKKILVFSIIVILINFTLAGCNTTPASEAVIGQWDLERITNQHGETQAVGKANLGYDEFPGQTKDVQAIFKEDGSFTIEGSEENLHGQYRIDKKDTATGTVAVMMNFDNGAETLAVFGKRHYQDGETVSSLLFELEKDVYSFIR